MYMCVHCTLEHQLRPLHWKMEKEEGREVSRHGQRGGAKVEVVDEKEAMEGRGGRLSLLPFEQLPSLPKPKIPEIDLSISRIDVRALQ